jgi:hypothetical protein
VAVATRYLGVVLFFSSKIYALSNKREVELALVVAAFGVQTLFLKNVTFFTDRRTLAAVTTVNDIISNVGRRS